MQSEEKMITTETTLLIFDKDVRIEIKLHKPSIYVINGVGGAGYGQPSMEAALAKVSEMVGNTEIRRIHITKQITYETK